jgi:elongation factor G
VFEHLTRLTGGRGTFVMSVDRFERLSGPRGRGVQEPKRLVLL